jgi:flagella basal body P-ring formation protein FlgA
MLGVICASLALAAAPAGDVVRAAHALPRGAILSEADLLPEGDAETGLLVGKALRRPVREGGLVSPLLVEEVPAIRRNEAVRIVFRKGAIELVLSGEALRDARLGERATVTIDGRHRPLLGRVTAIGEVQVP